MVTSRCSALCPLFKLHFLFSVCFFFYAKTVCCSPHTRQESCVSPTCSWGEGQEVLSCVFPYSLLYDHDCKIQLNTAALAVLPFYPTKSMERTRDFAYLAENVSSLHLIKGLWTMKRKENSQVFFYCFPLLLFIWLFKGRSVNWVVLAIHNVHSPRKGLSFTSTCFPMWAWKGWDNQNTLKYWLVKLELFFWSCPLTVPELYWEMRSPINSFMPSKLWNVIKGMQA